MSREITNDLINDFENDFNSSKANKIAARAAQENGIFKASQNLQTKIDLDPTFSGTREYRFLAVSYYYIGTPFRLCYFVWKW